MIVGVPKESYPGERRVGLVPMVVASLVKAGFEVLVEAGAGLEAGYPDPQYVEKGQGLSLIGLPCSAPQILSSKSFVMALMM